MTHSDAGRYSAKHAPGGSPDEKITGAIREKVVEGEMACAEAERIGAALGVHLEEVGRAMDLLEIRISRCQLGLFGYATGGKIVCPADQVDAALEKAIRSRLFAGRLPCIAAWTIASDRKISRMGVAAACETLKIRIKPCQLGAF